MKTPREVVVFAGPSLLQSELPKGLQAEFRPPAVQGDIAAAAVNDPNCVIGLIDGVFQGAPAVRHKEILWAMNRGAIVFGAASMGALRAAELAPYGMQGRGLIFRWYRRFTLTADDAVAVLHAPPAIGAAALTEALIDLRIHFRHLRRSASMDRATETALSSAAASLHYTERTLPAVLQLASERGHSVSGKQVAACALSQKQKDARTLLTELRDRQFRDDWQQPPEVPEFTPTDAFVQDMSEGGFSLDTHSTD